ncbi:hypothetical protein PMAYCL1PPCAC_09898, partial [Pristionchus mayeri]
RAPKRNLRQAQAGVRADRRREVHGTVFYLGRLLCATHRHRDCLIKDIDQRLQNELLFGDLILTINGETIKNNGEITAMLEKVAAAAPLDAEFEYSFMVKRPAAPLAATKADVPQSELQDTETMKVLKACVVRFAQGELGMKEDALSGKVFVSKVDPSYRSICKNVFNVGDQILSINGKMILGGRDYSAAQAKNKRE